MSAIFKANTEKEFFTPFGPMLGYFRMPDTLVRDLNAAMGQHLEEYSDGLVGKVRQELKFDKPLVNMATAALGNTLVEYHVRARNRATFGDYDHRTKMFELNVIAGWFVRQFEHEYNPLHIHTGCTLSCVGYLQLPPEIDAEWQEDDRDHYPSHGHLQFAHGTDAPYSMSSFMIRPRVGDFYIFPSHTFHCVYPFRSEGERRSFSMNLSIVESAA